MWQSKDKEDASSVPNVSDTESDTNCRVLPGSENFTLSSSSSSSASPIPEECVEVSDLIGGYGPWQRDIFVLLFLASIPSAWHNLQMTFMAPQGIDFWCARPSHLNVTAHEWRNLSAPPAHLGLDPRCHVTPYWRLPDNETVHESDLLKCTSWEYNSTFYPSTIIDEVSKMPFHQLNLHGINKFVQKHQSDGGRMRSVLSFNTKIRRF